MKKIGQTALMMSLTAGLAACGQDTTNNTAPMAGNASIYEQTPANLIDNAATEGAESNTAPPTADTARPSAEKAPPAPSAPPRPKAETPRPSAPPADPHAGHDMNNMSH